jgi:hypothetical protein
MDVDTRPDDQETHIFAFPIGVGTLIVKPDASGLFQFNGLQDPGSVTLSRPGVALTKVLGSHQRQLRTIFNAVLLAIAIETSNPIKVDLHSSRGDVACSPNSSDLSLVLIERVQLWIHISHDARSALVACLYYPENVTNSIRRYAPGRDALQITPDSR